MSRYLNSGLRFLGLPNFVGRGKTISFPIPYEALQYEGAALIAADGNFYYSDGNEWKIPSANVLIGRPFAQAPVTVEQQLQLRLSAYYSPGGLQQNGVYFEISNNGTDFDNPITRTVNDQFASLYQILYPDDGFEPGDEVYWRGLYISQDGTQSEFSVPYRQVMPDFIETPTPVTVAGALTSSLRIEAFASAYGWEYVETEWEVYEDEAMTTLAANVVNGADALTVPDGLSENTVYWWRARHGGRSAVGQPTQYSDLMSVRSFNNAGKSMILTFDLSLAAGTTVTLALGYYTGIGSVTSAGVNVEIDWGDGQTETVSGGGQYVSHTYDLTDLPGTVATVIITGDCTSFGAGAQSLEHLTRIEAWGFDMGLESVRAALVGAVNIEFVSPDLPQTVTDMYGFAEGTDFVNGQINGLGDLATGSVKRMFRAFKGASSFNTDISGWDASSVTDMSEMFEDATLFNNGGQPMPWDVSLVTDMKSMFNDAASFNADISAWNVSSVTTMVFMFYRASSFNADIGGWNTSSVTNMSYMFYQASSFNNGGQPMPWDVSLVTTMASMFYIAASFNADIGAWNVSSVTSMYQMFYRASAFNQDIGAWNTSSVTNVSMMFFQAYDFEQDIGGWDVSSVMDMSGMFYRASSFNNGGQPMPWNVSAVTSMANMFRQASSFNQDIGGWTTSSVTSMYRMFEDANFFNQDIGGWDVSSVTDMREMFLSADAFNNGGQPMPWNVSAVTHMEGMFNSASAFNADIGSWDVSSVTSMASMFRNTNSFNQDLGAWNVSSVTSMGSMFQGSAFNQNISGWDVSSVSSFGSMFRGNIQFDQHFQGWSLRPEGVSFYLWFYVNETISTVNWSKTLTGFANSVHTNAGPHDVVIDMNGSTYHNTVYDAGGQVTNAYEAHDYLTKPEEYTVTGASDANADGVYTLDGVTSLFTNPNGWYFDGVSTTWTLYDGTDTQQAQGFGDSLSGATTWDGVLTGQTVARTGPAWTITDGGAV